MRLFRIFKNELVKEAQEWIEEGLINEQQAHQICLRYGADSRANNQRSIGYNILIVLGFLFIGLSVITLLSANWNTIPPLLRTGGLIALTMSTQIWAWRQWRIGERIKATGFVFLGNLFYGASIILIAQIYHLGKDIPNEVWLWAIGCVPFALLMNSRLLMIQAMTIAFIWFFMEGFNDQFPALFIVFLISAARLLWQSERSLILLLATIIGTAFYIEYALAELWRGNNQYFDVEAEHFAISIFYFIAVFSFGKWLESSSDHRALDYAAILQVWSLRFGLVFLLVMSFDTPWEEFIQADWEHVISTLISISVLAAATLIICRLSGDWLRMCTLLLCASATLIASAFIRNTDYAVVFQILTNIALIASGIWLILQGIVRAISHYFFLGIGTILMTALLRYFDLIGDYIGAAALFFVFAIILMGSAAYWKRSQREEATQ